MLTGWWVGRRSERNPEQQLFRLLLVALPVARLAFVLVYVEHFRDEPWRVIDIRDGGFIAWPGLVVAVLLGSWLAWRDSECDDRWAQRCWWVCSAGVRDLCVARVRAGARDCPRWACGIARVSRRLAGLRWQAAGGQPVGHLVPLLADGKCRSLRRRNKKHRRDLSVRQQGEGERLIADFARSRRARPGKRSARPPAMRLEPARRVCVAAHHAFMTPRDAKLAAISVNCPVPAWRAPLSN